MKKLILLVLILFPSIVLAEGKFRPQIGDLDYFEEGSTISSGDPNVTVVKNGNDYSIAIGTIAASSIDIPCRVSTGTLKTTVDAHTISIASLGVSTGTLKAQIDAVQASTGAATGTIIGSLNLSTSATSTSHLYISMNPDGSWQCIPGNGLVYRNEVIISSGILLPSNSMMRFGDVSAFVIGEQIVNGARYLMICTSSTNSGLNGNFGLSISTDGYVGIGSLITKSMLEIDGDAYADEFYGGGSHLTDIEPNQLAAGSLDSDVIASSIAVRAVGTQQLSATGEGDYLKRDNTWANPTGSGDVVLASTQTFTGTNTFTNPIVVNGAPSITGFNVVFSTVSAIYLADGTVITSTSTFGGGSFSATGNYQGIDVGTASVSRACSGNAASASAVTIAGVALSSSAIKAIYAKDFAICQATATDNVDFVSPIIGQLDSFVIRVSTKAGGSPTVTMKITKLDANGFNPVAVSYANYTTTTGVIYSTGSFQNNTFTVGQRVNFEVVTSVGMTANDSVQCHFVIKE